MVKNLCMKEIRTARGDGRIQNCDHCSQDAGEKSASRLGNVIMNQTWSLVRKLLRYFAGDRGYTSTNQPAFGCRVIP